MKVSELMIREVKSCSAEDDLGRAAQIMWEADCGVVPVVDAQERVVGTITDRDACMAAYTRGLPLASIRVGETMARPIHCCSSEDSIEKALSIMGKNHVRRLPVIDAERKLVGILSLTDLAREAEQQRRRGGRQVAGAHVVSALAAVCQPRRVLQASAKLQSAVSLAGPVLAAHQADLDC